MSAKKSGSEKEPMSTVLLNLCIDIVGIVLFVILMNPLSMLLFQMFIPRVAAAFAHNSFFCGEQLSDWYTDIALHWPFNWSKWWIKPKYLCGYKIDQQITYFEQVNHTEEVLWALNPKAWAILMKDCEGYGFVYLAKELKNRDEFFSALVDLTFTEQKRGQLIKKYLRDGTLTKSQLSILADKACMESKQSIGVICDILYDYIERCAISNELTEKIINSDASDIFKKEITEKREAHIQKCATKHLYNLASDDDIRQWNELCAQGKVIYPAAQKEMSAGQYKIFHRNGHLLDVNAIVHFLWYGDTEIAGMIFNYEPKFGILDEKVSFVLEKHPEIRSELDQVIENTQDKLWKLINSQRALNDRQIQKMFDCPAAGDMVAEYIKYRPLPLEFHGRILECKNAEELIKFYDERYTSECCGLEWKTKQMAVSKGWIA